MFGVFLSCVLAQQDGVTIFAAREHPSAATKVLETLISREVLVFNCYFVGCLVLVCRAWRAWCLYLGFLCEVWALSFAVELTHNEN